VGTCWWIIASLAIGQTTLPSLAALNEATQQLYGEVQSHIVRVQVPVRLSTDHPLVKWRAQLEPKLRERLDTARARGESPRLYVEPSTTQPVQTAPDADRIPLPPPTTVVNVECVGIILSGRGDVLLPLFVDPAYVGEMPVSLDERNVTVARVLATDRQTGLTVVRMVEAGGTPVRLAPTRPPPGSTVLLISLTRRAARLALWAGGQDESGILFNSAGDLAGIVRNGHTLYPATFMPIVEQLLSSGEVRRARLGIVIHEVPLDDPQRLKSPALGARTGVRVDEVLPDSAAARAGLQGGDVILALAGEVVSDTPTFAAALGNRRGRTELLILREGEERKILVDLQVAPD
jgi:S1-C subfamily serine protease